MNDNEQDTSQQQQSPSLGEQLKAAREKAGVSLSEIESTLHVPVQTLISIEQDSIDQTINPLFVKGYIKSYASLVNLDKDEVLILYAQQYNDEIPPSQMQTFSNRTKLNEHNSYLNYFSWLVVIILCGALVWWWYQKSINTTQVPAIVPLTEQVVSETNNVVVEKEQSVEITSAQTIPAVAITPISVNPVQQVENVDATFSFSKDCWIKVTDSSNEILAIGIKKKGHSMTLNGVAPFDVILGAPDAVSITYLDTQLDITPFVNGKTARFSVPLDN